MKSNNKIARNIIFPIAICLLLGIITLNLSLPARAQNQTEIKNVEENNLENTNLGYLDLPDFKLPYENGENIRWTGGPHAYNSPNAYLTIIPSGQGSGLDFSNGDNFKVLAMAAGTVVDVSCDLAHYGFGCQVAIQHDIGGSVLIYAHLQEASISETKERFDLGMNLWVPQGAVIARAGDTGLQDNIHLHIELRTGEKDTNGNWKCSITTPVNRCLPGNLGGNPLGWDQLLELHNVDSWQISGYCAYDSDHECLSIFNYDGSATMGSIKVLYSGFVYNDAGELNLDVDMVRVSELFSCNDSNKDCELPENHDNPNKLTQFARDKGKGALFTMQNDIWGNRLYLLRSVIDLLYQQDSFNYAGELISSNIPVYIFGDPSTPTPYVTNPPIIGDGIQLCRGQSYGIPCQIYIYSTSDTCINLAQTGMDNLAQSVKFLGNYVGDYEVIMFGDNFCSVYNARYGSSAPDLGGLNKQISSIKIEKLEPADCPTSPDGVTLYVNAGYQGHCHTFTPGSYGDLSQFGLDRNITSIKNPNNAFAIHFNDGLNFTGMPGHFDNDVYDLGPNGWSDRARSVEIGRHIPTSCSPIANGAVLYVDTNYGAGCISVPPDIPNLAVYTLDKALTSLRFVGSYINTSKVEIYRQANYVDLCGTYWQDQSDLRSCAGQAVSVKILPYTPPTQIPTQPGDIYTGNVVPLAYRDRAGSNAVVDGSLSTEWIGGNRTSIGFSWSRNVNVHKIIVWDRNQSSTDNNQINLINIGFSDGTSIQNVDMTSGGPRCAEINFPDKSVNWVNVIPADASGNNGYREVEIWATTGAQYSNNSCVMKYNLTATGGGLQPPVITATPAITPTPQPINTPLPYDQLFGNGSGGDITVSGTQYTDNVRTQISGSATSGQNSLNVASSANLGINDEVLLYQVQGTNAGFYEFGKIVSISSNTITLKQPLIHAYSSSGNNRAQLIRVPQYNNLTIPSGTTLSAHTWDGTTGGILAFRVFGTLNLAGNISANALGFRGAPRNNGVPGAQGEGENGMGGIGCSANGMGAGGGGSNGYGNPPGGGGGGYATAGQYGKPGLNSGGACVGAGGNLNGSPELNKIFLGGGGGSGGAKTNDGAAYYGGGGGNGGGAILVYARTISGTGNITSNGQSGLLGGGAGTGSNGGGGAGGSVFIASQNITAGTFSAQKGLDAQYAPNHEQNGGDGADGRIRIEYGFSFSGNTNPQASVSQLLYLGNTPTPTATFTPTPTLIPTLTLTPTRSPTPTPTRTLIPTMTPTENCMVTSSAWLGEYWNNETLSGIPVKCKYYDEINFEWYSGSPVQGIASDHFSADWWRPVYFDGGTYRFELFHDDGARLYIDNVLVNGLNNWCSNCRTTDSANVVISAGVHTLRLELFEVTGWSSVKLLWDKFPVISSITRANSNPSGASNVDFSVNFSKVVTGVDSSDFTPSTTGVTNALITGVSGSGTTYTVTMNTGTGNGTIRLDVVDDNSIIDAAGNPLGGVNPGDGDFAGGETYTINKGTSNLPSVPALISPANNFLTTNYKPTLDWSNSTFAAGVIFDHYQLQVATDAGFTSLVKDVNIAGVTNSNYTFPTDLASNVKYYWRVRSANLAGVNSNWSLVRIFRTALTQPVLVSPANAFEALTPRPTFDWEDVAGATGFTIQISKNNTFTQIVHTGNPVASTYIPTVDLPKNLTLFWRVQTKGTNGPSAWSEVRSFLSANSPTTPVPSLPANNSLNKTYLPLFKWSVVTLPAGTTFKHYQLQVDDNADFSSPEIDDSSITNRLTVQFQVVTPLAHNTKFYWRVKAFNTDDEESNWSTVRSIRTLVDAPALVSPANGFEAMNPRPTFDWDVPAGPGAITGYTIQFSKNPTFTQIVHTGNPTTDVYIPTVDLVKNTTLYWRVFAKGANGPSLWTTEVRSFFSANSPSTPVPSLPAVNALITNGLPLFKWSAVTVPAGTNFDHYQLQVADNVNFTDPVINTSITPRTTVQFQTSVPLAQNTKFYWRVTAVNTDNEESNWSVVRTFRTVVNAATLLTPANGSATGTLLPVFDWEDASGPGTITNYTIQVSTSPTFGTLLVSSTTVSSTYTPIKNLPAGKTIYWRVKVNGANGPSAWSTVFSFITP